MAGNPRLALNISDAPSPAQGTQEDVRVLRIIYAVSGYTGPIVMNALVLLGAIL